MTVDHILSIVERVAQSKRGLSFDNEIMIRAVSINQPRGGGGNPIKRKHVINKKDWIAKKRLLRVIHFGSIFFNG
jgi:hypothetical protein